jgi:hypothetical protein
MLHAETQISIPPQYQQVCSALCTVTADARVALMKPRSNRDQERQKYYVLLQFVLLCVFIITEYFVYYETIKREVKTDKVI